MGWLLKSEFLLYLFLYILLSIPFISATSPLSLLLTGYKQGSEEENENQACLFLFAAKIMLPHGAWGAGSGIKKEDNFVDKKDKKG